jgi:hypothetical protein
VYDAKVTSLIYILWYAEVGLEFAAAYRLLRNGIWRRLSFLWIFLLVSAVNSTALICLSRGGPGNGIGYAWLFNVSTPVLLLLQICAIVQLHNRMTEEYLNYRKYSRILLLIFGSVGTVASAIALALIMGVPNFRTYGSTAFVVDQYIMLALGIMLAGTRFATPKFPGLPIRRSVLRAVDVMLFYVFAGFALDSLAVSSLQNYCGPLLPLLSVSAGLIAAVCWCALLTRNSDQCEEPVRVPLEEALQLLEENTARFEEFKQAANSVRWLPLQREKQGLME